MQIMVQSDKAKVQLEIDAQADWTSCLITGLVAAAPCFLEAFMKCIQGGDGGSTGFKPGDRERCE